MMIRGSEVLDELDLALGHAAADRHHRAAEPLGAVVRPDAAGEQAVAVGDVHHVARPSAGRLDRARHHLGPGVDVLAGVADHRGLARSCRWRRGCATTFSRGTANMPKG